MSSLFTLILLQPIFNVLMWLYTVLPGQDLGLAIIILTFLVKIILYPFAKAQIRQQKALQELQPKIEEVRRQYKDNKEEQAKQLMALYGKEKVNPAASCLPLLIQLPIFIALYRALTMGIKGEHFSLLYPFVAHPQQIDTMFFWLIDLSKPSYVLAVAAAAIQFFQTKQMIKPPAATVVQPPPEVAQSDGAKDESMSAIMNKQMLYMMPIMTMVIGFTLPGGLTLYWLVMSALTVLQQWWMLRRLPPKVDPQLSGDSSVIH